MQKRCSSAGKGTSILWRKELSSFLLSAAAEPDFGGYSAPGGRPIRYRNIWTPHAARQKQAKAKSTRGNVMLRFTIIPPI